MLHDTIDVCTFVRRRQNIQNKLCNDTELHQNGEPDRIFLKETGHPCPINNPDPHIR